MTAAPSETVEPAAGAALFLASEVHAALEAGRRVGERRLLDLLDSVPFCAGCRALVRHIFEEVADGLRTP